VAVHEGARKPAERGAGSPLAGAQQSGRKTAQALVANVEEVATRVWSRQLSGSNSSFAASGPAAAALLEGPMSKAARTVWCNIKEAGKQGSCTASKEHQAKDLGGSETKRCRTLTQ